MPFTISKALVAALAFGCVHALPQAMIPTPSATTPSSSPTPVDNGPTDNTELIAKLKTDATVIKRFQRLLTDAGHQVLTGADLAKSTIYDFQKGVYQLGGPSNGGTTSTSNRESLPILTDSGITMNYVTLGPCGIFLPHIHPRANEFFVVVEGEIDFGYILEVGLVGGALVPSPEINGKLTKFTGTLFPQGSIHYQINNSPECKTSTALATLSSDDPGATAVLQMPSASGGNATVVPRQADAQDMEDYRPILPANIIAVYDKCLARCFPKA